MKDFPPELLAGMTDLAIERGITRLNELTPEVICELMQEAHDCICATAWEVLEKRDGNSLDCEFARKAWSRLVTLTHIGARAVGTAQLWEQQDADDAAEIARRERHYDRP